MMHYAKRANSYYKPESYVSSFSEEEYICSEESPRRPFLVPRTIPPRASRRVASRHRS